jgi:hypothetical protein
LHRSLLQPTEGVIVAKETNRKSGSGRKGMSSPNSGGGKARGRTQKGADGNDGGRQGGPQAGGGRKQGKR